MTKGSMVTQRDDFEEYITRRNPFERLDLVDPGDLTDDERRSLPPAWLAIAELDGTRAVERALKMWEDALPGRFPGTVANLRDRGLGVFLARVLPHQDDPTCVVLVYAIRRNASPLPFDACFGYLPAGTSQFPEFWPRLSEEFRRFHTQVHDGFRVEFGGILLSDRLRAISVDFVSPEVPEFDYVDEHLQTLPEDRRPSLDNLVVVVREGSRGVAVDVSTPDLTAWETSELIEPCRLGAWSAMDAYVMSAMSSDVEYYERLGYRET
ncbi:MAG: hypothetical protein WBG14_06630 [Rhodococcus sp. (in: high G+C Gram-positive bacteria)]